VIEPFAPRTGMPKFTLARPVIRPIWYSPMAKPPLRSASRKYCRSAMLTPGWKGSALQTMRPSGEASPRLAYRLTPLR